MMRALFIVTTCLGLMPDAALAAGDIVAGEKVFHHKCIACHEGAAKKAPNLRGVVGRPVASLDGFAYSDGLKAFAATGAVWDEPTLDKFLQNINTFVKGMRMTMTPVYREADRVNLIAFLKSYK